MMTARPYVWHLARLAGCADPDSETSAGARFLDSIYDACDEARCAGIASDDIGDTVAEIADAAPDVYTHKMWQEFVDLAAYHEDPSELGADPSDMDQCARICLYMIAERLAAALLTDDDDDDDDE